MLNWEVFALVAWFIACFSGVLCLRDFETKPLTRSVIFKEAAFFLSVGFVITAVKMVFFA